MVKEKQLVHARIGNPVLVRKALLESAISSTDILKSYRKLKKIRIEKRRCTVKLKQNLQDIKKLMEKLGLEELPRPPSLEKPSSLKKVEKVKKKKVKEIKKEEPIEPKGSGLDSELRKLQEKLKNL